MKGVLDGHFSKFSSWGFRLHRCLIKSKAICCKTCATQLAIATLRSSKTSRLYESAAVKALVWVSSAISGIVKRCKSRTVGCDVNSVQASVERVSILQLHRNFLLRRKLFHIANEVRTVRPLEFLGRGEWQTAFTFEKFFESPVAGTVFAPDDSGRDELAQFATIAPSFQPVFVADGAFNRNRRDI